MEQQKSVITTDPWDLVPSVTWEGRLIYRHPRTGELAREEHDRLVELPPDAEKVVRSLIE